MNRTLPIALLALCAGCFSEHAHPMRRGDIVRTEKPVTGTTRERLRHTHDQIKHLLPTQSPTSLTTEDLTDKDGKPVDVCKHFNVNPTKPDSLFTNFFGLSYSAQLTGPDYTGQPARFKWDNYEDVWIPVRDGLSLHGSLGLATKDGAVLDAPCVVVLPGLLGWNDTFRTRDLCSALRANGIHALALETRSHGQTVMRYPDESYAFGSLEAADLMRVSDWLTAKPHITTTGLIGFCWGANEAIIAAWYHSVQGRHPCISERIAAKMPGLPNSPRFTAGVMAFSPVLKWDDVVDALDTPHTILMHPVYASLQGTVHNRMVFKKHANPNHSLRSLIAKELARSPLDYPEASDDVFDFHRLLPYKGKDDGNKLADMKVPVLIIQAADDPLASPQAMAELFARIKNPNVAGLVLPSGGHVGFAAWARAYYFSLIVNFFSTGSAPLETGSADR
ncbi:MAG: alpha/beta fold hydrolase [Planctomycetes bacterium]|nr:alpha/beta fold hydrolase [Planctomycetota bacterium]